MTGKTICVIGDTQVKPGQNLDHLEHVGRYIADKRPDVIVQIGDWWDMPSLSSYDRGKASFEGRRVKEDIEAGYDGMKRMLEPIKKLQQSQRYFKKKVYSPRMVMTLGNHECLTPDTEVMTSEGFKVITEVTTNDLVATMNSDWNLEWNNPLGVVVKSYNDDLVVFNSRSFAFAGTKKHRMYYKDSYGKLHEKEANSMPHHFTVITSFENQNMDYPISEDLLKLSAWLCTDSYFTEYGKPIIYQRESNAHKIQVLLDSIGVGYNKIVRDRDIKEICGKVLKKRCEKGVEFHLQNNPSSVKSNKYLPKFVSQLSQKQWEIFLEVLIDADGTVPKSGKKSRVFYGQKRICDDVQFYAVQFGWTASLTEYRPNQWRVNLVKRTSRKQEGIEKEYVHYEGLVHCLVMPHENFVIRKNNKVHLTGNCRLDRSAEDNPELVGFIGTKELNIEQYGWEVHEFLKPVSIEGINFVHYLANPMTGRPYSGSAAGMLKTVGASFVMGHKQVLDVAIRTTLEGKNQIGIINGSCYEHHEDYKGWQGGNAHFRGITMLYEAKDGFALPSFISLDFLRERYGNND